MSVADLPALFEPDAESMPAEQLTSLQLERLRALVDRLLALGGVQGVRLKEAGVTAGADVNLAVLSRLPTTSKTDLCTPLSPPSVRARRGASLALGRRHLALVWIPTRRRDLLSQGIAAHISLASLAAACRPLSGHAGHAASTQNTQDYLALFLPKSLRIVTSPSNVRDCGNSGNLT